MAIESNPGLKRNKLKNYPVSEVHYQLKIVRDCVNLKERD